MNYSDKRKNSLKEIWQTYLNKILKKTWLKKRLHILLENESYRDENGDKVIHLKDNQAFFIKIHDTWDVAYRYTITYEWPWIYELDSITPNSQKPNKYMMNLFEKEIKKISEEIKELEKSKSRTKWTAPWMKEYWHYKNDIFYTNGQYTLYFKATDLHKRFWSWERELIWFSKEQNKDENMLLDRTRFIKEEEPWDKLYKYTAMQKLNLSRIEKEIEKIEKWNYILYEND